MILLHFTQTLPEPYGNMMEEMKLGNNAYIEVTAVLNRPCVSLTVLIASRT